MALADTTNRWIAGHFANAVSCLRDEERLSASPRSRSRRLAACMAAANNYNVGVRGASASAKEARRPDAGQPRQQCAKAVLHFLR